MDKLNELKKTKIVFVNGEEHEIGEFIDTLKYFAIKALCKYEQSSVDCDELITVGAYGLFEAVNNFNPSLGFKFSTYASPYVENAINSFMRDDEVFLLNKSAGYNKPSTKNEHDKTLRSFQQDYGHEPTACELARYTGNDAYTDSFLAQVSVIDKNPEEESEDEVMDTDMNPMEEREEEDYHNSVKAKNDSVRAILSKEEELYIKYKLEEGLCDAEIARRLKKSPTTISTTLFKIIRKRIKSGIKSFSEENKNTNN